MRCAFLSQICVLLAEKPKWTVAKKLLQDDSFLHAMSRLSPATVDVRGSSSVCLACHRLWDSVVVCLFVWYVWLQAKSIRIVRRLVESTKLLALAEASKSRATLVLAEWVVEFVRRFDAHHASTRSSTAPSGEATGALPRGESAAEAKQGGSDTANTRAPPPARDATLAASSATVDSQPAATTVPAPHPTTVQTDARVNGAHSRNNVTSPLASMDDSKTVEAPAAAAGSSASIPVAVASQQQHESPAAGAAMPATSPPPATPEAPPASVPPTTTSAATPVSPGEPTSDPAVQADSLPAPLGTITQDELDWLRSHKKPPKAVISVMGAICVLLAEKPKWKTARVLLKDRAFLHSMQAVSPASVDVRG